MTRTLRPALPAFLLLLGAVGLGVPASPAQSKGAAKKKPAASKATATTAEGSAQKASASKAAAGGKATSKTTAARTSSPRKSASGVPAAKSPVRGTASARTGRRTSGRLRRQPGQKAPSSDRVTEIQAALAKDGSFAGMPNGKWDDETVAAMRRFQAAHGLNPTGKLDARSLQKLGLGSQTAGVAAPTPPPGAVSRLTSSAVAPTSPTEAAGRQ